MGMGWDFKRIGGLTPPPFSLHERYFSRKQKPSWYIHSSLLETKKLPQILADQIYLLLLLHQLGCHILRPDWLREKYNSLSRRILGGLGSRLTLSATRKVFTEGCDLYHNPFSLKMGRWQMNLLTSHLQWKGIVACATLGNIFSCKSRSIGMGDCKEPIPILAVFKYRLLARLMKIEAWPQSSSTSGFAFGCGGRVSWEQAPVTLPKQNIVQQAVRLLCVVQRGIF